jgi:hypothetical protein
MRKQHRLGQLTGRAKHAVDDADVEMEVSVKRQIAYYVEWIQSECAGEVRLPAVQ